MGGWQIMLMFVGICGFYVGGCGRECSRKCEREFSRVCVWARGVGVGVSVGEGCGRGRGETRQDNLWTQPNKSGFMFSPSCMYPKCVDKSRAIVP